MAFFARELCRGALIATGAFLAIAPLGYAVLITIDGALIPSAWVTTFGSFVIVWMISFVAMAAFAVPATLFLGVPFAWLLGLAIARSASIAAHLIAFATLGLAVGGATTAVALPLMDADALGPGRWLIPILATGAASAFGWWRTMIWGIRRDEWLRRGAIQSSSGGMPQLEDSERSNA